MKGKRQKAKDKKLHVEIALLKMCFASRKSFVTVEEISSVEKKTVINQKVAEPAPQEEITSEPLEIDNPEPEAVPEVMDSVETEELDAPNVDMVDTPNISSLEDILKQAEAQVDANGHGPKALKMEDIEEIWSEYLTSHESSTTASILKIVLKKIVDDKIVVVVPSNIAKEEIQQETELYALLREHFNQGDLVIQIDVDREQFPDIQDRQSKKLITPKEKYDHLKSVNPLVDDLINKLDLKLEQ